MHRAAELRPATLLDLLSAADALRRPERLDTLLAACAADACSRPGAAQDYPPAALAAAALAVVKAVDAGAHRAREIGRAHRKPQRDDAMRRRRARAARGVARSLPEGTIEERATARIGTAPNCGLAMRRRRLPRSTV